MIERDDNEGRRAIEAAESWLRADRLRIIVNDTANHATIRAAVDSDEQALSMLVQEHYKDSVYSLRSVHCFGAGGQDEDDTFVLRGSIALPCDDGECEGSHQIDAIDVYVRSGFGFQHQAEKSTVIKPIASVGEETPVIAPPESVHAKEKPRMQWLISWWWCLNVYFDVLVCFVMLIALFGGLIDIETRMTWIAFVLTGGCFVDFVRALPRLWAALKRAWQ